MLVQNSLFDPVGTVIIDLESETQDELVSEQISAPDSGSVKLERIEEVIFHLRQYVDMENTNRISIRRRYAFEDYLAAVVRQKKKIQPERHAKGDIYWKTCD